MTFSCSKSNFRAQYPGAKVTKDGDAIEYEVEDSNYRIYDPSIKSKTSSTVTMEVKLDHIRGGATDDHVDLTVVYDTQAHLVSVSYEWEAGNDGYQIPETLITAVDIAFDVAGLVGAFETAGISEEVAEGTKEVFDVCCKAFNDISKVVVKWSDNGGRMYFIPVVCHTIIRLSNSVSVTQ